MGCEIAMENDANCFALSESVLGSAKGYDVVFGVIMGTGVGGGIVINETYTKEEQTLPASGGITHYILMEMSVIVESKDVLRRISADLLLKSDG